ncbi:hypothetical protein BV22DRAFT_713188 [Leucogyrophana mollusca]|uniref:Uncharacterized protein n=1 Tax=Leucogyrophana mollusca TaxID=85980 RepID=A0ACB8B7A5_9AGAM|nr:hypothetical protein BV22DRAFT_713188 [Leucogyrophana mollusca]
MPLLSFRAPAESPADPVNMDSVIGVKYTPAEVDLGTISVSELSSLSVKFIRIQWTDMCNSIRFRVIPLSHFKKLLATARPSVSMSKCVLGVVFVTVIPGFSVVGEYLYVVDTSTLRICPYAPGHAVVFGHFQEKTPVLGANGIQTLSVPICARTILDRIVKQKNITAWSSSWASRQSSFSWNR